MTQQLQAPDDQADVSRLFLHHVSVVAALGRGDFAHAYREVTSVVDPGADPAGTPEVLWFLLDLAEAAQRSGHHDEAGAHLAATRASLELVVASPRLVLHARATAALMATGAVADELFEDALRTPGATSYPFDLARVHLLYGEHLRRAFAPARAREQLRTARATFGELGAARWLERADAELRAVAPERARSRIADLTPQELEIALLAASGLSNKEIAQQRYLSPRTVGAHLYRTFPKLGITSRAALRDALSSWEVGADRQSSDRFDEPRPNGPLDPSPT